MWSKDIKIWAVARQSCRWMQFMSVERNIFTMCGVYFEFWEVNCWIQYSEREHENSEACLKVSEKVSAYEYAKRQWLNKMNLSFWRISFVTSVWWYLSSLITGFCFFTRVWFKKFFSLINVVYVTFPPLPHLDSIKKKYKSVMLSFEREDLNFI